MGIAELHNSEYETYPDFIVSAPGSLPLIGEHTEISDGVVLAAGMSLRLEIAVSLRNDSSFRFFSSDMNERKRATSVTLKFKKEDRWANYPKSVLSALTEGGITLPGVNTTICGAIPQGIGLGSSAALVVAASRAYSLLAGNCLEGRDLVDFCRRAELAAFGKRPSPSEHAIPVFAAKDSLVRFDTRTGRVSSVPFETSPLILVLTDSRVPRHPVEDELKRRADDVRKCLAMLGPKGEGGLRFVSVSDIDELMGSLQESTRRRCLFIVEETGRTVDAVDCLRRGEMSSLGRILNKSQQGLRNLYEVSCPETDWLIKRAGEIDGIIFSRMTGKGFGGCTISLMTASALEEYRIKMEEYERIFGFRASYDVIMTDDGVRVEGSQYQSPSG